MHKKHNYSAPKAVKRGVLVCSLMSVWQGFLSGTVQLKMFEEGKMLRNWSDYLPAARVETRILGRRIEGDPPTG